MDRKSLKRAYKETLRPMGVFQVKNTLNGKIFIGASRDLPAMLNRQQAQLKFGGHPNKALQQDYNSLGADVFVFEVLDELKVPEEKQDYDPTRDLQILESLWMERLLPYEERGYHARPRQK